MKGIEQISKRVDSERDWVWEKELEEFLDHWSKDDLAYVHFSDITTRADQEVSELCVLSTFHFSF
jgi:hypothetical protein